MLTSHGGPGTFAYSPLDSTSPGTSTNPGFPLGGSASYTGETVALQNTTFLTGTVRVDVTWGGSPATNPGTSNFSQGTTLGTMSLTISGLASAAGDPLTYGGAPRASKARIDADDNLETTASGGAGREIADIVLGTFNIVHGVRGPNVGDMIVGEAVPVAGGGDAVYNEISPTAARLRYTALGQPDNPASPVVASSGVKALFVGRGVDGPLGVIGTYTIDAGDDVTPEDVTALTSTSIGRLGADGLQSVDVGATIYGAFGAQVP